MISLEEEAIKYAVSVYQGPQKDVYENSSRLDFIAGATCKWVQINYIKERINALQVADTYGLKHTLEHYEKRLKELEDVGLH